jgi:IclR family transcriptional regulator, mhp operon transcriptional activator
MQDTRIRHEMATVRVSVHPDFLPWPTSAALPPSRKGELLTVPLCGTLSQGEAMTDLGNRSLERGIMLMEVIARTGEATLADLHRECGIPKSTIRRLLATLMARRIVRQSLQDRKFRINVTMPTSATAPIPRGAAVLIDVALPILTEHTRRVSWPSDIQVLDGTAMRIIDSTRPLSPFHLYRGVVNTAINMFGSATGLACLAAMPNHRILELAELAKGDPRFSAERFLPNTDALLEEVHQTRERGYGIRLRQYRGERVADDGLRAIGVPIRHHAEVFGAISLLFPRHFSSTDEMARLHLASLKQAAETISGDLDRFSG